MRTISNRDDFSKWAMECTAEILASQGCQLVAAAQQQGDEQIREIANVLAQVIVETLLVYDGLIWEEEN